MNDGLSRREFLGSVAGAGLIGGVDGRVLAALIGGGERVIFESSFERGQPMVAAKQHSVVEGVARTGKRSMMGEVKGERQACFLEVPFESKAGHVIHASCWVKSEKRSAAALFVRVGKKRVAMARRVDKVPTNRWVRIEGRYEVPENCKGFVQFVAPSSHSAPDGKAWIDSVRVWETESRVEWPGMVQDFGELAYDGKGRLWMASLERTDGCGVVRVDLIENGKRRQASGMQPRAAARPGMPTWTGTGRPAIAGLADGHVVARAFEEDGRWRIGFGAAGGMGGGGGYGGGGYLDCEGTVNISPVVATVGKQVFILWESNAGGSRGIYACRISLFGGEGGGAPVRISSGEANSYNPAVVAMEDGSLFAAWDSLRGKSADIYGAWYRNGRWEKERRITSDARIERHPALAVRDGEVWMAWQMQSYRGLRLNSLTEQRIAVARVGEDGLHAPVGLFDKVSTARRMLLRPRIAFDSGGRLWLTVRESLGQNSGWRPMVWSYSGREWSGPSVMMDHQGRWRPVSVCSSEKGTVGVCQYDDLPPGWDNTRGKYRDWRSGLLIETFEKGGGEAVKLETEPLQTPETDFSLAERISMCSAELP
ncbi:MAG: TolB-like translocation protein, partial [Planctomycetota bacterium]